MKIKRATKKEIQAQRRRFLKESLDTDVAERLEKIQELRDEVGSLEFEIKMMHRQMSKYGELLVRFGKRKPKDMKQVQEIVKAFDIKQRAITATVIEIVARAGELNEKW